MTENDVMDGQSCPLESLIATAEDIDRMAEEVLQTGIMLAYETGQRLISPDDAIFVEVKNENARSLLPYVSQKVEKSNLTNEVFVILRKQTNSADKTIHLGYRLRQPNDPKGEEGL